MVFAPSGKRWSPVNNKEVYVRGIAANLKILENLLEDEVCVDDVTSKICNPLKNHQKRHRKIKNEN